MQMEEMRSAHSHGAPRDEDSAHMARAETKAMRALITLFAN
jgi:hypothetical protein